MVVRRQLNERGNTESLRDKTLPAHMQSSNPRFPLPKRRLFGARATTASAVMSTRLPVRHLPLSLVVTPSLALPARLCSS
jgi:hypothetical protein